MQIYIFVHCTPSSWLSDDWLWYAVAVTVCHFLNKDDFCPPSLVKCSALAQVYKSNIDEIVLQKRLLHVVDVNQADTALENWNGFCCQVIDIAHVNADPVDAPEQVKSKSKLGIFCALPWVLCRL